MGNITQRNESENDNKSGDGLSDATGDSLELQANNLAVKSHNQGMRVSSQHHNSFKRLTPANALSASTRQSKRNAAHQQREKLAQEAGESRAMPPITVGALEVPNVNHVANRYGTLPKGARIGAFLESLESNNELADFAQHAALPMTENATKQLNEHVVALAQKRATHNHALKLATSTTPLALPQQMIRSNSSSGVTMLNNANNAAAAAAAAASATNARNNNHNKLQRHRTTTDCSMVTFSSFRGAHSPKRVQMPSANLFTAEFSPPPPPPLPVLRVPAAPQEEFNNCRRNNSKSPPPPSVEVAEAAVAALTAKAFSTQSSNANANVNTNTNTNAIAASTTSFLHDVSNTAPSVEEASTRFGVSLRRRDVSAESCQSATLTDNDTNHVNNNIGQEKMLNGNKGSSEDNLTQAAQHTNNEVIDVEINCVGSTTTTTATTTTTMTTTTTTTNTGNAFKTQLKKIDVKKVTNNGQKVENKPSIINFKAHLRKVENTTTTTTGTTTANNLQRKNNNVESISNTPTTSTLTNEAAMTAANTTTNATTTTTTTLTKYKTENQRVTDATTTKNNSINDKLNKLQQQQPQQQISSTTPTSIDMTDSSATTKCDSNNEQKQQQHKVGDYGVIATTTTTTTTNNAKDNTDTISRNGTNRFINNNNINRNQQTTGK